jgi:hypothetical protein
MTKIKNSVWGIFTQGITLYFKNFNGFFKYMSFPVFGQILGIILILLASYFYAANLPKIIVPGGLFDNFSMIFLVLFLVTLPGLLILIKAFWDYLVAYGAINSMLDNMLKSGKLYDFHAHTEVITRRSGAFGWLWGILAILGIIALFPLFWVIAGIMFIYFILVFQVFVFEPEKSIFGCFQKSVTLIKGNFVRTLILAMLVGIFSYWAIPEVIKFLCNFLNITTLLAIPFDNFASQLPINNINALLAKTPTAYQINSLMISKFMVSQLLIYIVTSLTLPLRVICWGLWYKNLSKQETVNSKEQNVKSKM